MISDYISNAWASLVITAIGGSEAENKSRVEVLSLPSHPAHIVLVKSAKKESSREQVHECIISLQLSSFDQAFDFFLCCQDLEMANGEMQRALERRGGARSCD